MDHLTGRFSVLLLSLLCVTLLLCACSSSVPRRRGGKLSDAATQAAKPPEEQERVRSERTRTRDADDEEEDERVYIRHHVAPVMIHLARGAQPNTVPRSFGQPTPSPGEEDPYTQRYHRGFLLSYDWTHIASNELDPSQYLTVGYSDFVMSRVRAFLGLHLGLMEGGPNTLVADGMTNLRQIGLEGNVRLYLTPDHTFMGLYGVLGLRWGELMWDYRNPIHVQGESDPISGDQVQLWSPYIGAGISLMQTDLIHIGIRGAVGLRLPYGITEEGFDNDVFPFAGFQQIGLDLSFMF